MWVETFDPFGMSAAVRRRRGGADRDPAVGADREAYVRRSRRAADR